MAESARQGLQHNWKQFTLLVVINGFVGAMVGLERTILPGMAEADFLIAGKTAIMSFIIVFGITKAISNYYAGALANRLGRKNLLVIGWTVGLSVPPLLIWAPSWNWVIAANVLLGINQGLTWSTTVLMKIDMVGEKNRGLAMGLNESAGYLAVGIVAFLTSWIAADYGLRPYPFYLGIGFALLGLIASLLVKDTRPHSMLEARDSPVSPLKRIFRETTWRNKNLGSVTQAGLVNNLNDGMMWGLFPLVLATKGFDLVQTGKIVAIYPIFWGLGQLGTGRLADLWKKKNLLFAGMLLQALAIGLIITAQDFIQMWGLSALLGIGTALVYPTFLASIADHTHPRQRAECIGIFRLWRDLGYAFGAMLTGLLADLFHPEMAILVVALITLASAIILKVRMD